MYDFEIPDEMTLADFNRHPVRQVLRASAFHGSRAIPLESEIATLDPLPLSVQVRLRGDCQEVAEIHDEGRHADAWARADELAAEILNGLPLSFQDPDFNARPRENLDDLSPDELAARVPQR